MIDGVEVFQDPDVVVPPAGPVGSSALPVLDEAGGVKPAPGGWDLPADFPANAKMQDDGSVILTLEQPVTLKFRDTAGAISSESYKTLHLHRLKGKHRKLLRDAAPEMFRAQMIACSTSLSLGRASLVHDEMDEADIVATMRIISFFMTPGRKTGP